MATLRDYLAYARGSIHSSLSEEAGQALIQAYVGECVNAKWLYNNMHTQVQRGEGILWTCTQPTFTFRFSTVYTKNK